MTYAWIITKDYFDEDNLITFIAGPSGVDDDDIKKLKKGGGVHFKMYDDDKNLCLSGRFLGDENSEDAFGPLDDYGMPGYGCTGIKYKNETTGKWEYL